MKFKMYDNIDDYVKKNGELPKSLQAIIKEKKQKI